MTKILLDTNAYSEFMTGNTKVLDYIVEAEEIYVSTVMIGNCLQDFMEVLNYRKQEYFKSFVKRRHHY